MQDLIDKLRTPNMTRLFSDHPASAANSTATPSTVHSSSGTAATTI
jgi:hypothetical protein